MMPSVFQETIVNASCNALDAVSGDPEAAHLAAEKILLNALDDLELGELADAYRSTNERIGFWYAQ